MYKILNMLNFLQKYLIEITILDSNFNNIHYCIIIEIGNQNTIKIIFDCKS